MGNNIEQTSDGLKLRDASTGKLAGSVATKGKSAPRPTPASIAPFVNKAHLEVDKSNLDEIYASYKENSDKSDG